MGAVPIKGVTHFLFMIDTSGIQVRHNLSISNLSISNLSISNLSI